MYTYKYKGVGGKKQPFTMLKILLQNPRPGCGSGTRAGCPLISGLAV